MDLHPAWIAALAAWCAAFAVIAAILAPQHATRLKRMFQGLCIVFVIAAFGALALGAVHDAAVIAAGGAGEIYQ